MANWPKNAIDFAEGLVADGKWAAGVISAFSTIIPVALKAMGVSEFLKQFSYAEIVFAPAIFWLFVAYVGRRIKFNKLEAKYAPKLAVSYSADDPDCHVHQPLDEGAARKWMIGIRLAVTPLSDRAISKCYANLVGISKKSELTGAFWASNVGGSHRLPWNGAKGDEIEIPSGVKKYVEVLVAKERTGTLYLAGAPPFRFADVFKEPVTYRLKLIVAGEQVSHPIEIEVDWKGKWRDVPARQVEPAT